MKKLIEELITRVKSYPVDTAEWDEPGLAGEVISELTSALRNQSDRLAQFTAEMDAVANDRTIREGHSGWVYAGWVAQKLEAIAAGLEK